MSGSSDRCLLYLDGGTFKEGQGNLLMLYLLKNWLGQYFWGHIIHHNSGENHHSKGSVHFDNSATTVDCRIHST